MTGRSKKHARRSEAPEMWYRGDPGLARERWKHRVGRAARHATINNIASPPGHDRPDPGREAGRADGEPGPLVDAHGEVVAAITSLAETALQARERAERDAQRIRDAADAYAEAKRIEAERLLEDAIREAVVKTGMTDARGQR